MFLANWICTLFLAESDLTDNLELFLGVPRQSSNVSLRYGKQNTIKTYSY